MQNINNQFFKYSNLMEGIKYTELMGENVKDKLKYCGKDVKIYNLAKAARETTRYLKI